MKKLLKGLGAILAALVLLIVLALVLLVTCVSPNRLKPILTTQVMKATGRVLTIDGNLSWSFFPYFGVKVEHMALGNPDQFKQKTFAEIENTTVGVKVLPLLHGQIESNGVVIHGMTLNLIKNAAGQMNWNFQSASGQKTMSTLTHESGKTTGSVIMGLAVSAFDITDSTIHYVDEQQNKKADVTDFELHAKNINLMELFPVTSEFNFAATNPALSGHVTLSGEAALNLVAQVYSFRNAELAAQLTQAGKKIQFNFTGDILADLNQQTIEWNRFKGQIENISLVGQIGVTQLKTAPVATGQMKILPFDLKQTFTAMGQPAAELQTAKDVSGTLTFSASAKNVDVQSNLKIDTLQAAKLTMKNFIVTAHLQNGTLNLAPFTAALYQGKLEGQASVNLNAATLPADLHLNLSNIQAGPLLQDLGGSQQKLQLEGVGNLTLNVTTALSDPNAVTRNLNGSGNFNFNNGAVVGVDLGYLVDTAYALAKQKSPTATNNNRTNFGNLTGTMVIHSGVLSNNDLASDSPRFLTKGQGTIDLVNQRIDYHLQTAVKQRTGQDDLNNAYGTTIPVDISGNLSDPSIKLDSRALVKAIVQQQVEKEKNKLQDQVKQKLNEKGGELLKGLLNR